MDKLPEKWWISIKDNPEVRIIVGKWLNDNSDLPKWSRLDVGYETSTFKILCYPSYFESHIYNEIPSLDYKEITLQDFKTHVLKGNNMRQKYKLSELTYPMVIHITSKEQHKKLLDNAVKIDEGYQNKHNFGYLIGYGQSKLEWYKKSKGLKNQNYIIIEFEDIIFPESNKEATVNMFKKGDYIVALDTPIEDTYYPKNYIFKQRKDGSYLLSVLDAKCSTGNGWVCIDYNKNYPTVNYNWRYATPEEIAEYDRLGKPYDVTTLKSNGTKMNTIEKYEEGKYYHIISEYAKKWYIMKKGQPDLLKDKYIKENTYSDCGGFGNRSQGTMRLATEEEIKWLDVCIAANKFISKEEALKVEKQQFKEGDYIIRTWPSGKRTLGKVVNGFFQSQENYNQEGGVRAGENYGGLDGYNNIPYVLATPEEIAKVTGKKEEDFYQQRGYDMYGKWIPKVGELVSFYSEIQKKTITSKLKDWTSHSYCILESGDEPFKHLITKAKEEPMNTYGLKVGDELPERVINKWVTINKNYLVDNNVSYVAPFKWTKTTGGFVGNRKIEEFRLIDGCVGFLLSETNKVYLKAEGFKEFMENFDKPKVEYPKEGEYWVYMRGSNKTSLNDKDSIYKIKNNLDKLNKFNITEVWFKGDKNLIEIDYTFTDMKYWRKATNEDLKVLEYPKQELSPFPEKWYIIRNKENAKVLNKWLCDKKNNSNYAYLDDNAYFYYDCHYHYSSKLRNDCTEITFEQFKKYVLGKESLTYDEIIGLKIPQTKQSNYEVNLVIPKNNLTLDTKVNNVKSISVNLIQQNKVVYF